MMLQRTDLLRIKWPLLVFITVSCASTLAYLSGRSFASAARADLLSAQRQLDAARFDLASAEEDGKNMHLYLQEYERLLARNVVGEERRLDWIEDMEKIRRQSHVPDFSYTLSPRRHYAPQADSGHGRFNPDMSDMSMRFRLLHEGQLLDFLDGMQSGTRGWFILHDCVIERATGERDADNEMAAMLSASCTGGWLTLPAGDMT